MATATSFESKWFWETFLDACAEQALALDLKLPNHIHNEAIQMFPSVGRTGQREAGVRSLLHGVAVSAAPLEARTALPTCNSSEKLKTEVVSAASRHPHGAAPPMQIPGEQQQKKRQQQTQCEEEQQEQQNLVQNLFSKLDVNGDGAISLAEFSKAFQSGALDAANAVPLASKTPGKPTPIIGKLCDSKSMPHLDSEASTRAGSTVTSARSAISRASSKDSAAVNMSSPVY